MTIPYLGNAPISLTASGVLGLFEQHGPVLAVETRGHRYARPTRGGPPERDSRR
jgi:hypothetical protein